MRGPLLLCRSCTLLCVTQTLYSSGGYTYLDVRTALEVEEVGKVKDSVNIPFMLASRKYDPETRTKKIVKEPNTEFIKQVRTSHCEASKNAHHALTMARYMLWVN